MTIKLQYILEKILIIEKIKKNLIHSPITFSGLDDPAAILVMGMALVFDAMMQWGGTTASTSLITLCLMLMSSKTASITMSALRNDL